MALDGGEDRLVAGGPLSGAERTPVAQNLLQCALHFVHVLGADRPLHAHHSRAFVACVGHQRCDRLPFLLVRVHTRLLWNTSSTNSQNSHRRYFKRTTKYLASGSLAIREIPLHESCRERRSSALPKSCPSGSLRTTRKPLRTMQSH